MAPAECTAAWADVLDLAPSTSTTPFRPPRSGGSMSKPTVENLGIDLSAQRWQRSGTGNGTIEVAMVAAPDGAQR